MQMNIVLSRADESRERLLRLADVRALIDKAAGQRLSVAKFTHTRAEHVDFLWTLRPVLFIAQRRVFLSVLPVFLVIT